MFRTLSGFLCDSISIVKGPCDFGFVWRSFFGATPALFTRPSSHATKIFDTTLATLVRLVASNGQAHRAYQNVGEKALIYCSWTGFGNEVTRTFLKLHVGQG